MMTTSIRYNLQHSDHVHHTIVNANQNVSCMTSSLQGELALCACAKGVWFTQPKHECFTPVWCN